MKTPAREATPAERRVRLVTGAILLAGAAAAVVIFIVNGTPREAGFELEHTKPYLHDMAGVAEACGGRTHPPPLPERARWF